MSRQSLLVALIREQERAEEQLDLVTIDRGISTSEMTKPKTGTP